ncbi:hypothetical protein DdX_14856 [Ditylenchus destructor]|uniref:Uncharacterized protein n=1 Tax=Ditylenchus destructor TaxID=166010 RepID=A0AAD4MWB2_9BILA|nr:hypothetical protein DdX_14856 [Ditylenchus destructor]
MQRFVFFAIFSSLMTLHGIYAPQGNGTSTQNQQNHTASAAKSPIQTAEPTQQPRQNTAAKCERVVDPTTGGFAIPESLTTEKNKEEAQKINAVVNKLKPKLSGNSRLSKRQLVKIIRGAVKENSLASEENHDTIRELANSMLENFAHCSGDTKAPAHGPVDQGSIKAMFEDLLDNIRKPPTLRSKIQEYYPLLKAYLSEQDPEEAQKGLPEDFTSDSEEEQKEGQQRRVKRLSYRAKFALGVVLGYIWVFIVMMIAFAAMGAL